jgi:hypothetical protein
MKLYDISPEYLAGLADSDGSFSIYYDKNSRRKNGHHKGAFQLGWKYSKKAEQILNSIKVKYKGNICRTKNKQSFNKTCDVIKYMSTNKMLYKLIIDILPFLLLKKKQAQLILKLSKTYKLTPGSLTKRTFNYREKLYQQIRNLNTKNAKHIKKNHKFNTN